MPQRVLGQADGYRLLAGDYVKLAVERTGERIPVNSGRWRHTRIMALGSDKPAASRLASSSTAPMFHRTGYNRPDVPSGRSARPVGRPGPHRLVTLRYRDVTRSCGE
jgi:hypothetical protein